MCLAEALLRIPDKDTADALIAEKIGGGRWEKHLGASDSSVRQRLHLRADADGPRCQARLTRASRARQAILKRLVARSGEPFIRQALRQAMRILADNFVLGRTIEEALARAAPLEAQGLPVLLRHAGRAGQDGGRRDALLRSLHGGDRGDRQGRQPALRA